MNALELSQQIHRDQERIKSARINGFVITALYHYDILKFSVSKVEGFNSHKISYLVFNENCQLLDSNFTPEFNESEYSEALEKYLNQVVK